ncbi:hypothetical protein DNTS_017027 [Danionella cerebrum]|uniref:Uncharacterized protein n=1 Tax=Danionella cerebrum TaxID=2873325 RepID=A0A553QNY2_9TELE|nr:hypothetical protein DNTS_017027 [Danionella translucida]TRY91637.1 hypothetical protein DNTS_017027 [Danionella translucida]
MPGFAEETQNMFQEGLHQVFFKERPLAQTNPEGDSTSEAITEDRLVIQVFCAVFCMFSSLSYTCLTFTCSASMTAPVWCAMFISDEPTDPLLENEQFSL